MRNTGYLELRQNVKHLLHIEGGEEILDYNYNLKQHKTLIVWSLL